MTTEVPIHVLIRVGVNITEILTQHRDVLDRYGSVWFAKLGKTLAVDNIWRLNAQIRSGVRTSLYFVGKEEGEHRWFIARLVEVQRHKPSTPDLMPSYYCSDRHFAAARLWFRIASLDPLDAHVSRGLFIKSSGAPATEAMRSMAAMFIVVSAKL